MVNKTARSGGQNTRRRSRRLIVITILPTILLIVLFYAMPIIQAVLLAFARWTGVGPVTFVGIANYVEIFESGALQTSLIVSLTYSLFTAIGIMVIATLLAAAVSANLKGSTFYRVVWFLPAVAPSAAVAVYWNTAFQPGFGTFNALLELVGLPGDTAYLANPATALGPVVFVSIWGGVSFAFLLVLGGMEQVPVTLYEAARVDGASATRAFFSITLPLIRPVLATTLFLQLIGAFNNFTTIWGMTKGGPGDATTTIPVLVYKEAFIFGDFGTASALAVISSIGLMAVGLVALRASRSLQS